MLLRIIMYYDPTLSVLLYSIQNCFFLLSSEGSLLFCNFFFIGGFFLVWIGFTAEIHFSVLFLLDVARVVGGFQTTTAFFVVGSCRKTKTKNFLSLHFNSVHS